MRSLPYLLYALGFLCLAFTIEEDSYIYFRVAENIASGAGYVFNVGGEHIETGSSPLWQYLLALVAACHVNLLFFAKIFSFALGAGQIFLVQKISRELSDTWYMRYLPALAYCLSVPFLWWANSGLETPLYTLILLYCLWLSLRAAPPRPLQAVAFVLLYFSRPEAILAVAVFAACLGVDRRRRRFALTAVLAVGLCAAAYEIFRIFYFHDLQISPFYAKIGKIGTPASAIDAYLMTGRLIWLLPAALAVILIRPNRKTLTLVATTCAPLFFFVSNYDHKPFFRFLAPALPLLLILGFLGLDRLSGFLQRVIKQPRIHQFAGAYAAAACLAIIWTPRIPDTRSAGRIDAHNPIFDAAAAVAKNPLATFGYLYDKYRAPLQPRVLDGTFKAVNNRIIGDNYQAQVGSFLAKNYPSARWVVYDQMGQTPYFAGPRFGFIDLLGLTTKSVGLMYFGERNEREKGTISIYRDVADATLRALVGSTDRRISRQQELDDIFAKEPELILIHMITAHNPGTLTHSLATDPRLNQRYIPRYWLANLITVYERRDLNHEHDTLNIPPGLNVVPINGDH